MAYTPKDGSGALFKNDKQGNEARPDYRGDLCINGVVYEVAGWIKPLPSDASKRFMSLSAKPKEQRQEQRQAPQRQAPRNDSGFDDFADVPF